MNWGNKLAIFLGLFIITMISIVVIANRQTNEMIDEKYYEAELKYQDKINAQNNFKAISLANVLSQNATDIIIALPDSLKQIAQQGTIEFIRYSDKSKDQKMALQLNHNGQQYLPKSNFIAGYYHAKINFTANKIPYFTEENITITK